VSLFLYYNWQKVRQVERTNQHGRIGLLLMSDYQVCVFEPIIHHHIKYNILIAGELELAHQIMLIFKPHNRGSQQMSNSAYCVYTGVFTVSWLHLCDCFECKRSWVEGTKV